MDKEYFGAYIAERAEPRVSPFRIFTNQAGYFPESRKKAVMPFPCKNYSLTDENGRVCFEGKTTFFGHDKNSGDDVYIADFSGFAEAGRYRVVSGEEKSALFSIGGDIYNKAFDDISKSFYYLRCGCGLDEKHAGEYRHGKCHNAPALLWEDKYTSAEVSGGWHDAGDYGRYVTSGACAASHLMYSYKLFPHLFEKQQLNIPENGMPDILSECRYELEWLLKMQRSDGAVYHKATTKRHAQFVMPEDDKGQMYVFPVSSMAAAAFTAVCALASGVYKGYDRGFSEKLLAAAERSCQWLGENRDFIAFENPEGCNTGGYYQWNDFSNRFWAYAEMYALTGDEKYHNELKAALENKFSLTDMGYAETGGLGALAYLLCPFDTDSELKKSFVEGFGAEAERLKAISDRCGYGCAMEEKNFHWGSNMDVLKHGMIFAVSDVLTGTKQYRAYAEAQLDYLFGVNPLGFSYVTGSGEFRCNYPHLRPAYADGVEECIPGMVSGGPNRFPGDEDAKILIPYGTPPMKCYADNVGCYSLNEITIYWNSSAVFVLAYARGVRSR